MNLDDGDIDLGLALGSRNHCIQTRLNPSSGAGGNATSRVDMAFAASDPLSELVWSPLNGLSLKCTDPSSAEKKPFLMWNVGPNNKGLSTSQTIVSKGSEDDQVVEEEISTKIDADEEFGDASTLVRPCRNWLNPELGARYGHQNDISEEEPGTSETRKEEHRENNEEEDLSSSQKVQLFDAAECRQTNAGKNILTDGNHNSEDKSSEYAARSNDVRGLAVGFQSEPHVTKISKTLFSSPPNPPSQPGMYYEATSQTGEMPKNEVGPALPALPLTELEFSAENDLDFSNPKEIGEMRIAIPVEASPSNSRMRLYREKGKAKTLSDGGINTGLLDDEDDSYGSVESCNSAGLFSKGVKRKKWDQELIGGSRSKIMKNRNKSSHDSTSVFGPDRSFLNWISNMVKGLSDSHNQEASPHGLSLAHPSNVYAMNHQEITALDKNLPNLSTGFQTVFKSLYCQNDTGLAKNIHSIEEAKELMSGKALNANTCEGNNDDSCKQIIVSNNDINQQIIVSNNDVNQHGSERVAVQTYKPWIFSADFAGSQENKALDMVVHNKEKIGTGPSDSLCKEVNINEKGNSLTNLWITRLYTRAPRLENGNQMSQERSSECPKENLGCQINDTVSFDQRSLGGCGGDQAFTSRKICASSVKADASFELESASKINPIQPSPKRKSSEAMASVFARRLDALRNIVPSKRTNSSSCTFTCFFCGGNDHDLRECMRVSKTELEDLLVKISSFDRLELDSQSMCIRCLQLDHWAVSCPYASSICYQQSNRNSSGEDDRTSLSLNLCAEKKCSTTTYLVSQEKNHTLVAAGRIAGSSTEACLGSFPSFLPWSAKQSSSKKNSISIDVQKTIASNSKDCLQEARNLASCDLFTAENNVTLIEMFNAIKKLRLSRADILRCMNHNVPLSYLNGFFLRLRLGKLEAGISAAGYYAASITGDAWENISCGSEKSILVDVGGIKSSVGSQYISNHDFLEEEIKAWWCRTVETGGKIPSLDELKSKFDDRRNLGF